MQAEEWARKYDRALSEVKESIRYCRMFVTGFNTNIDGLRHVEGEEIERIVTEKNLEGEIVSKLENPPREIKTLSDLVAGILFCAENGVGEEWFIRELEVFETIRSVFGYDRLRMGGQGGIMTNVLALLDLKVIPNVVALPQIQAEQFTTGRGEILIPRLENGRIVFKNPLEAARESDKIFIHSIFEFDDRFCARVGGRTIRAPVDNRFIATYDDENVKVKVDPAFWEGTLTVIDRVGVAMLSGYHMLQSQYPDGSKPEDHIRNTIELIKSWRERNPELRIHTEIGFVADDRIRESILNTLTPHIDSIGLNEDELADNLYTLGRKDNLEEIRDMNAAQIYVGARRMMEKLGLKRVMVHSRDFSICLLSSGYGVEPRDELYSVLFGSLLAATLAHTGNFPTVQDTESVLRSGELKISEKALREQENLASHLESEEGYPGKRFLEEGFTDTEPFVVFAPSNLTEPRATVGLGDTICSGSLAAEEALKRKKQRGA